MTEVQRIKKVVNWLIFQGVAENEKEIADILNYRKSSFSQILNGKVPLSEKFVKKLAGLDDNINEVWILSGKGEMFKNNPNGLQKVEISQDAWRVIQLQAESLVARDRQIDELVDLLKKQIQNQNILADA